MATNAIHDSEVYHTAGLLIRRHGRDAVVVATMRADESLALGDMDAYRTWKRLALLVDADDSADNIPDDVRHA